MDEGTGRPDDMGQFEPMDMGGVDRRRSNQRDPEVTINHGNYQAASNVPGTPLFEQVAIANGASHSRPDKIQIGRVAGDPQAVAGIPTTTPADSAVAIRWDTAKNMVYVDMYPILMKRNITVPKDTRMHIPISIRETPAPACIIFHFDRATYEPIEHGKRKPPKRKKKEAGQKDGETPAAS